MTEVIKVLDINQIYKMLDWRNPNEIQLEGIRMAREINDLSLLIQPPASPICLGMVCKDFIRKN